MLSEPLLSIETSQDLQSFCHCEYWSQLIAASHSDSKNWKNSSSVHSNLAKVLSLIKLWSEAFGIRKKIPLKKKEIKLIRKFSLGDLTWLCQTFLFPVSYFNFNLSVIRATFVNWNFSGFTIILSLWILKPTNCCFTFWFQKLEKFFECTFKFG